MQEYFKARAEFIKKGKLVDVANANFIGESGNRRYASKESAYQRRCNLFDLAWRRIGYYGRRKFTNEESYKRKERLELALILELIENKTVYANLVNSFS